MAMEDFRVDVVIGKGPGATAIPLEIPPFTLVGATTRAGLLPGPLRDRFGFTGHLEFYEPHELDRIVHRSAGLLGVELTGEGAAEIASRSRGTPRIANRLLRRVRDYAQVRADGVVTLDGRPRRARALRGRRARPRPARPRRPRRAVPPLRRRTGRGLHAGRRRRRGARDRRGGRRAVPGPQRLPGPHAAGPGRHPGRLGAPRARRRRLGAAAGRGTARRTRRCSRTDRRRPASHSRLHLPVGRPCPLRRPLLPRSRGLFVPALVQLLPLVGIALLFWLLLIRPASQRQKELGRMQSSLKAG